MPPHAFKIRSARLPKDVSVEMPYVPDTAPVVETRSGVMTRVWLEWARRVTGLAAQGSTAGGGGAPDPHHLTHEPGGTDALQLSAASRLFGRGSTSAGAVEEISLGTGLAMSGTTINATGSATPGAHHTTHEPGGTDAMAVDAVAATGSLRTLGTGATQAAPGNDARFTAAPQLHAPTHQPGGTDAMAVDAAAATGSLRTLGTAGTAACAGNDARLTNARTPTAHQATHRNFGSDPLLVGTLSGYPMTTGVYLDGLGNFTAPAGTTPGPHHATHEPGGGDALVNAAWVNQANVFTQPQTLQLQWPTISFNQSVQPADQKYWHLRAEDGPFYLRSVADSGVMQVNTLKLDRNGDVTVARNLTATGAGGNVACKDQANVFTQIQTLTNVGLILTDTTVPANTRVFVIGNSGQVLSFWAENDALTTIQATPLTLNRGGDALIGRDVYEKGRALPMGHWVDVPFNAANCFSNVGSWTVTAYSYAYSLVGKTLHISFATTAGSASGNPTLLHIALPSGLVPARTGGSGSMISVNSGANWTSGLWWVDAGTGRISLAQNGMALWTGPAWVYVSGTILIS